MFVAVAVAAKPRSDLVGKWNCCGSGGAASQTWKITSMNASSGSFKGTGGNTQYSYPITGRLSGRSVKLTTGPYIQLTSYSATFTGTVSANGKSMSGSWDSTEGQTGTWKATLATALKKFESKGKTGKGNTGKGKSKGKSKGKGKAKSKGKGKAKGKKKTTTTKGKGAGGNKISITGPVANVYHTYFNETVHGTAVAPANYLISGEQLYPAGGCASTYTAERTKSDWYQWPTGTGRVGRTFSLTAKFWARNHNEHGICAYLINSATQKTYGYAARWWNNS